MLRGRGRGDPLPAKQKTRALLPLTGRQEKYPKKLL
jgi:hypothetical protein